MQFLYHMIYTTYVLAFFFYLHTKQIITSKPQILFKTKTKENLLLIKINLKFFKNFNRPFNFEKFLWIYPCYKKYSTTLFFFFSYQVFLMRSQDETI